MRFFGLLAGSLIVLATLNFVSSVQAAEPTIYTIIIKDHKFQPAELKVPAGQAFKLLVKNTDPTAEEFESHDLHREKIIAGNSEATISMRALEAGTYKFFGEFNESTAQGQIIVE